MSAQKLSDVDRAYLAGFFDADGAIMASIERHPETKYGFRVRLSVKIAQKNRELLDAIRQELGFGSVRLNRTVHEYCIKNQQQVRDFIILVYPYSRVKRKQLTIALKIAEDLRHVSGRDDLIMIAQLADELAFLNVRSKDRRKNYAVNLHQLA